MVEDHHDFFGEFATEGFFEFFEKTASDVPDFEFLELFVDEFDDMAPYFGLIF